MADVDPGPLAQLAPLVRVLSEFIASITEPESEESYALVERFAMSLPTNLTIDDHSILGGLFERAIQNRTRLHLADTFWASLPDPIDFQETIEYEPVPLHPGGAAQGPPIYPLPKWFFPKMIAFPALPPQTPFFGSEVQGLADLNEWRNIIMDLHAIKDGLHHVNRHQYEILDDPGLWGVEVTRPYLHMLEMNFADKFLDGLPDEDADIPEDPADLREAEAILCNEFAEAERRMLHCMRREIVVDNYLEIKEAELMANPDTKFIGICLRFERTRLRHALKYVVTNLRTEHFRRLNIHPISARQDLVENRPFDGEHQCPICTEEPEEGEIPPIPAVTYLCCKRPYHAECLLEWLFAKIEDRNPMDCPWCRKKFPLEFVGYVMMLYQAEISCL